MVEADFSGDYVNIENTKAGDILTITGEGAWVEITMKDGRVKNVLNIPVINNGVAKIFTPSRDCGKAMIAKWGKDTLKWVNQKLQAAIVKYKSFGVTKEMIDCAPLE